MPPMTFISSRCFPLGSAQVLAAWEATQVELQGQFSTSRLRSLSDYVENTTPWRVFLIFLITPLPCLALILLVDAIPLVPPEDGIAANYAFWLRSWAVVSFIDYNVILIIGQSLPQLSMSPWHPLVIGVIAGSCSMAVTIPLASLTFFPFPFGSLVASPPSVFAIFVAIAYLWGPQLRADAVLRRDMMRYINVFVCQVTLTFVYPMFISVFETLDGHAQTFFVLLLPVIKIIAKNWISCALGDQYDAKPEAVIFNVEVFHALYVSTAMQSSTSMSTTSTLMVVDLVQCWISVRDVIVALRDVRKLLEKIPPDHALANASILEVSLALLLVEDQSCPSESKTPELAANLESCAFATQIRESEVVRSKRGSKGMPLRLPGRLSSTASWSSVHAASRPRVKVAPTPHPSSVRLVSSPSNAFPLRVNSNITPDARIQRGTSSPLELDDIFTRDERAMFVRQSAHALFTAEYVVLVEYTEVAVPLIYGMYLIAIFQMPTCAYYPPLAALDGAEQVATITNVLAYAGLELLSLVLTSFILKSVLGVSSALQLAFVLDTQKTLVQAKLTMWVVYVLQFSLVHLGADFTFQFTWLHRDE